MSDDADELEARGSLRASPEDWQRLADLAILCRDVGAAWEEFFRQTEWKHTESSPMAQLIEQLKWQPSPDNYAWGEQDLNPLAGSAFAYMAVARNHLEALAVLLENGVVMFSLGPIVRAIVEHCSRVAWAIDPRPKLRVRLARAFWILHDDLNQARRLAKAVDSAKDVKQYTDLLNSLRRDTLPRLFWKSERKYDDKNGSLVTVHGEKLPGFSEMAGFLAESFNDQSDHDPRKIYDFLSANTHPTIHIIRNRMRAYLEETEDTEESGKSIAQARLSMQDLSEPRDLTYLSLFYFIEMWRLLATYYGLDANDPTIIEIQEKVKNLQSSFTEHAAES